MTEFLEFVCEGQTHKIRLSDNADSETVRQLKDCLPTEITIHCAKIAGCHIYWPSPILARLEDAKDIHTLPPGAFLYYPDRQYLELIYGELQAEKAAVTYLGQLEGNLDWLKEFATRQRQEAGKKVFKASVRLESTQEASRHVSYSDDTAWGRIRNARRTVWKAEPAEVRDMLNNSGHNIPLGPMATADAYFRCVQESLWQLWNTPERFPKYARKVAAINALELGISRIGHYCHLTSSEAVLHDAIDCIQSDDVEFEDLLKELILYCSRMSNWVDLHIPWYAANELALKTLGRTA